jgi:hypothetical protein
MKDRQAAAKFKKDVTAAEAARAKREEAKRAKQAAKLGWYSVVCSVTHRQSEYKFSVVMQKLELHD